MNNIVKAKVKFVRNLKGVNFEPNMSKSDHKRVLDMCFDVFEKCGFKCAKLKDISTSTLDKMLNGGILEKDFVDKYINQACGNNESLTIQINGKNHVEIFAIPSVIIAAVRMKDGEYSSQIRRIHTVENDLAMVERYNAISYTICREAPELDEFDKMIHESKTKRAMPSWVSLLGAAMAAGSFAVFFGGSWRDGIVACVIGVVMTLLDKIRVNQVNRFAKTALQSFFGGVLAYLSVMLGLGDNAGMIIIGTIMLLIPGIAFGTALRDLLCGDFLAGSLKTIQAVLIALMIAFGYLIAMLVT